MHRPLMPDVFEIPACGDDAGRFPWVAAAATAAIVIGAAMLLVAAHEDLTSTAPQVTVAR